MFSHKVAKRVFIASDFETSSQDVCPRRVVALLRLQLQLFFERICFQLAQREKKKSCEVGADNKHFS